MFQDIYEDLEDELKKNLRSEKRVRRVSDVIDSMGDREIVSGDYRTSKQSKATKLDKVKIFFFLLLLLYNDKKKNTNNNF